MGDVVGSVVGSVVGGVMGNDAADAQASAATQAADTSAAASRYAADLQKKIYDQTRQDQAPWRAAGGGAINRLSQLLGIDVPASYQDTSQLQDQYNAALNNYNNMLKAAAAPANYASLNTGENGGFPAQALWSNIGGTVGNGQSYDQTALNAAERNVNDLYARLQGAQSSSAQMQPRGSDFGSLTKNFSMADYKEDPGYQFRLSEGQKALDRAASAGGRLYSGRAMKDMSRFNQDQASNEYQNAFNRFQTNQNNQFNRLASLAGVGQTANNALTSAGQNYANNAGNYAMTSAGNMGTAQLIGGVGRSSAYSGLGNSLGNLLSGNGFSGLGNIFGGSSVGSWNSPSSYSDASGMWS